MDQVWHFYEAGHENLKRETIDMATAMRAAFSSKTDWQKYILALAPKKQASSKIMPKEKYREVRRLLSGRR